jgi:REP element-mobilizing transposase RayT
MSRQARGFLPAGIYHVTTRSAGPAPVFTDADECRHFCELIRRSAARHGWKVLAFCVMSTHYHLLVEVPDEALKAGMKSLNWRYARWFNSRRGRWGHLFGDRYYCVPVKTEGHLLRALRYIARNPVRAGLCKRAADWRWSSYARLVGLDNSFPFVDVELLRGYFGANRRQAIARIRQFVDED